MDIAVHVGTLLAVLLYFRSDVKSLACGGIDLLQNRPSENRRLTVFVIIATIPILCAGFVMHLYMPEGIRSVMVIALTSIIFGLLLGVVDHFAPTSKSTQDLSLKGVILVGLSQCLALIPGTSRSGITMTAARFLGLTREHAARFSLLLSIPTIAGAGFVGVLDLYKNGQFMITSDMIMAMVLSFLSALIAIYVMMRWLKKSTFMPFVIYRVILGIVLIYMII